MNTFSSLLGRFKHIRPPDESVRLRVVALLNEYCSGDVDIAAVTVKNGTIYVSGEPALKSELFLKRRKIMDILSQEFGDKKPQDIR